MPKFEILAGEKIHWTGGGWQQDLPDFEARLPKACRSTRGGPIPVWTMLDVQDLPTEALLRTFRFLGATDLLACSGTSGLS